MLNDDKVKKLIQKFVDSQINNKVFINIFKNYDLLNYSSLCSIDDYLNSLYKENKDTTLIDLKHLEVQINILKKNYLKKLAKSIIPNLIYYHKIINFLDSTPHPEKIQLKWLLLDLDTKYLVILIIIDILYDFKK